nr:MAG TPA: hypothetical protein [Caudoviricetes sp.]
MLLSHDKYSSLENYLSFHENYSITSRRNVKKKVSKRTILLIKNILSQLFSLRMIFISSN